MCPYVCTYVHTYMSVLRTYAIFVPSQFNDTEQTVLDQHDPYRSAIQKPMILNDSRPFVQETIFALIDMIFIFTHFDFLYI